MERIRYRSGFFPLWIFQRLFMHHPFAAAFEIDYTILRDITLTFSYIYIYISNMQVILETRSVPKSQGFGGNIYIQKKKKKRNSLNRVWKKYWNTYWIFKVNITLFKIIRSFRSRIPKPFILSPLFNFFFLDSETRRNIFHQFYFYSLRVKINFSNSGRKQKRKGKGREGKSYKNWHG